MNLKNRINPVISELTPYQPGKNIAELAREKGFKKIIKLASNENPLGPPPKVQEILVKQCSESHRYPDDGFELKQQLADELHLDSSQFILGNGSDELFHLIAKVFLVPGDEVIISEYAFASYRLASIAHGGKPVTVAAKNFGHDLEAMQKTINKQTKLIFLANPNNPTGTFFQRESLVNLLQNIPRDIIVVLDEAYFEYMKYNQEDLNAIDLLPHYPNLLITRTFSKVYGLAGLRIGYGMGNPELISWLTRGKLPFNVNTLALKAAQAALSDKEFLNQSLQINQEGHTFLTEEIAKLGFNNIATQGNFVTIHMKTSGHHIYNALLAKAIIIRPLHYYHMDNYIRVTIGLPEENQQFIEALAEVLKL